MSFETIEKSQEKKEISGESKKASKNVVDFKVPDFSAEKAAERKNALRKIEELEKRSGLDLHKTEDEIEDEMLDKERESYESMVNDVKDELLEHIGRKEYLEKLKIEFNGNVEKAEWEQGARIENIKTVKINILSNKELKKKLKDLGRVSGENFDNIAAFYIYDYVGIKHELFVPFDNDDEGELIQHEFLHASTKGPKGMSDSARKALDDSYAKQGFFGILSNKKDRYYKNPTERLVRKQALDLELEKLGIKKYGEEFADEHYDKMMEYYKKGKFSWDANNFIKRTNRKNFKKIFNEIAAKEEGVEENPA